MRASLHPKAEAELAEAQDWYQARSRLAAIAFFEETARTIGLLLEAPLLYSVEPDGTRRVILRRFPFAVHYRVSGNEIVVVAIAHHRRRPGYWSKREV